MALLLRTALFVPGNRPNRIEKAFDTQADAIIVDLEDAVPLSEKDIARSVVGEKISKFARRLTIIRINGLETQFVKGDLESAVEASVDGIMLPKVNSPEDIREINRLLCELEKTKGLPEGSILLFPLIESAAAIQNIYEIVSTQTKPKRVYTVAFGAADYTLDMGVEMTMTGGELHYARSKIAIACRAAGIAPPIDTPFMIDINNTDALVSDAKRANELGFRGKLVIHPKQIEPCNQIFSPTPEEIDRAEKIVREFKKAESAGTGAIQLEGKFIDYPVVQRSRDILEIAAAISRKK